MRIQSIELENYRQYRGQVVIELSCDRKRNINVIQGVNGSGKSNLMNAINWCLYGKEEHLEKYEGKKQPIINDAELRELGVGETVKARVTIHMIDEKGHLYIFEREVTGRKGKDGIAHVDTKTDAHAYMRIGKDMTDIQEREFLVNRILPDGIKSFFFFDGEKLDEFFKEEKSASVRDAILDVSQLSLLDKAMEHLEKTTSLMRGQLKGESPRVDQCNEAINEVEKGRDHCRDEKNRKEQTLGQIRSKLKDISDKLKTFSEPLANELHKQRDRLKSRLGELDNSLSEAKTQASDSVVAAGPVLYVSDAISSSLAQIAQRARKGEIPPKIRDTFLKELLEKGECICGTDVSRDSRARKSITDLMKEVRVSAIYDELTDLKYKLDPMLKEKVNFIARQDKWRKQILNLEQQFGNTQTELREVETRLQGINVEEIANLEIARKKLEDEEDKLLGEIGVLGEKIKNASLKIDELQRALSRELEKSDKFELANKKLRVAQETYQLLARVRNELIDETRNTIEKKTNDYFLSLIWKKGTYDKVTIDDKYDISVINKVGSECLGTLSAGERQVLALSFLAALREVSGFDAPVVIDTPLGRISKEPKENIAEMLPGFLKEAQVTMFMTDEEYTEEVRERLAKTVGKEYELVYNEAKSQTRAEPYAKA